MTAYKKILLIAIITFNLISCGRNKTETDLNSNEGFQEKNDTSAVATSPKKDTTIIETNSNEIETKGSVLSEAHFSKNPDETAETPADKISDKTKTEVSSENNTPSTPAANTAEPAATKKPSAPSQYTIQKILNGCEIGETLTQEDLSKHLEIPKDAIKLVKNITKVSEDEIDVKWNSTWAVEKLSDAKFKDGRIKARFVNNSVYISGGAIAIKCEKKIYTDFVVTGRKAHIPSVKGYYWKIGRD
ncbi:hypothetical protein [Flavobacterium sp.]|jgi:hypothetical protein|uniref:hypothetical protein n=1 Tax=Flavobacterium sp. TaxID=239 RepID=UPI0037C0B4C0